MAAHSGKEALLIAAGGLALYLPLMLGQVPAGPEPVPDWQIAAGGKRAFEVASVKRDPARSDRPTSRSIPATLTGRSVADFPPIFR